MSASLLHGAIDRFPLNAGAGVSGHLLEMVTLQDGRRFGGNAPLVTMPSSVVTGTVANVLILGCVIGAYVSDGGAVVEARDYALRGQALELIDVAVVEPEPDDGLKLGRSHVAHLHIVPLRRLL